MSIKESIFACEPKQREVDLSELTGVSGQKGTMVELTLGDRELLEKTIGKEPNLYRAAYIAFCLYEDNENGELVRVFSEDDISRLANLPFHKLHYLAEEAFRVCSILADDETTEKN